MLVFLADRVYLLEVSGDVGVSVKAVNRIELLSEDRALDRRVFLGATAQNGHVYAHVFWQSQLISLEHWNFCYFLLKLLGSPGEHGN